MEPTASKTFCGSFIRRRAQAILQAEIINVNKNRLIIMLVTKMDGFSDIAKYPTYIIAAMNITEKTINVNIIVNNNHCISCANSASGVAFVLSRFLENNIGFVFID